MPAAPNERYVGLVLLFSTSTGEPLAIYPDGVVQRMRTGATSGVAAKYMAREDARIVALLGTGWQAGAQAMAICAARPVTRIRCYSPREEGRRAFATEMSAKLGVDVIAGASAREAVRGADIVLVRDEQHAADAARRLARARHACEQPQKARARRFGVQSAADVIVTHSRNLDAPMQTFAPAGADLARDTDRQKARLAEAIDEDAMPTLADLVLGSRRRPRPRKRYHFVSELYRYGLPIRRHRRADLSARRRKRRRAKARHRLVYQFGTVIERQTERSEE